MTRTAVAIALGILAALPFGGAAQAQTPAKHDAGPATHDQGKVEAGTYSVDPNHTQVMFTVSHMGFSSYTGTFSDASGQLTIDPAKPDAGSLEVSVPVKSIMTTSTKLDGELKDAQWLDAAKFPDMRFKATKIAAAGKGRAKVTGDLTIHGITRPVTLAVAFVGAGTNPLDKKVTVGFVGEGEIRRSDFGVKTYVPLIGDMLHLTINAAFERDH